MKKRSLFSLSFVFVILMTSGGAVQADVVYDHWSEVNVVETITDLGGGLYQYSYELVNTDIDRIWAFGIYTNFIPDDGTLTIFDQNHLDWGIDFGEIDEINPLFDARNLDPDIEFTIFTYTDCDIGPTIAVGQYVSGFSFIADTYDPNPKYYSYNLLCNNPGDSGFHSAIGLTGGECSSIVGTWSLYGEWEKWTTECTFFEDGTFLGTSESYAGAWEQVGCHVEWSNDTGVQTWGVMSADGFFMAGETESYGNTGTWYGTRPQTRHVDCTGGGDFETIQECIDSAVVGDTCLVAPCTYVENIDFLGKEITVLSEQGPDVTIIDGSDCTAGVEFCSVVLTVQEETENTILEGFTITQGIGSFSMVGTTGGGIVISESSPTVRNCTITENSVTADGAGGGIGIWPGSSPFFTNCRISNNEASDGSGGGIFVWGATPTFESCWINDNRASDWGGGIGTYLGEVQVWNCMILGNVAGKGGGMSIDDTETYSYYNTIADNQALESGGGVFVTDSSAYLEMFNSIIWGNSAPLIPGIWGDPENLLQVDISYSDIQMDDPEDLWPGTGNINEDPLFGDQYHLTEGSPCIDAATDLSLVEADIDGDQRPSGGGKDMGADEFVSGSCFIGVVM